VLSPSMRMPVYSAFDQRHHLTSAWAAGLSDPRWPLEELLPRADLRNRALMEAGRASRKSCSSTITEGLRFLPRSYAHEATLFKDDRRRLIQGRSRCLATTACSC
jgi:hypothetical protein